MESEHILNRFEVDLTNDIVLSNNIPSMELPGTDTADYSGNKSVCELWEETC